MTEEPRDEDRGGRAPADTMTFRAKHVYGVAGLALGLVLGALIGATLLDDTDAVVQLPRDVAGAPAAQQQPDAGQPQLGVTDDKQIDVATDGRPSRGPQDAKVTIVEFTDYQCPFCKKHFEGALPELEKRYGDKVKYVVRNFPLANIHPKAEKAAAAAECAFDQDKFWQYHDELFKNQTALDEPDLHRHARAVGLDAGRFRDCLESDEAAKRVKRDLDDGTKYGVTGTPTLFINGRKLEGAQPYGNIGQEIERALKGEG